MAVANVKKIELYVHETAVDDVLSVLQERGFCEISAAEKASTGETSSPVKTGHDYASELNDVNYLVRYLAPYYTDPVGSLGRILGERDDVSVEKLAEVSAKADVAKLASEVRKRERRLTEIRTESQQISSLQTTLSGLAAFTAPLSMVTEGSSLVAGFIGTGTPENLKAWKKSVEEALGADAECAISLPAKGSNTTAWGSVFYLRTLEDKLQET